jgi:hypothetical protein
MDGRAFGLEWWAYGVVRGFENVEKVLKKQSIGVAYRLNTQVV